MQIAEIAQFTILSNWYWARIFWATMVGAEGMPRIGVGAVDFLRLRVGVYTRRGLPRTRARGICYAGVTGGWVGGLEIETRRAGRLKRTC
jgi:hypothetical protein